MEIKVSNLEKSIRLDNFLQQYWKISRSQVHKDFLINEYHLNGNKVKKIGIQVKDGDVILVCPKKIVKETAKPFKIDLAKIIVHEDNDLIVINKPKDLLVHATKHEQTNVLWNMLKDRLECNDYQSNDRFGVFQRIDRNTTGLIVIAKNQKAYDNLYHQLAQKVLIRKYLAIVHHHFKDSKIIINVPIIRKKDSTIMEVSDNFKAKEAYTIVSLLKNLKDDLALVECELKTGRTHQIRVHLAYIKHPVFNDDIYGKNDGIRNYHQFLHSYYLSFYHPKTNQYMEFKILPDKIFLKILDNQFDFKKYEL